MSDERNRTGTDFGDAVDPAESLEQFRQLVNAVDDGIYQLDPKGRFVAVNDAVVQMTGYERDELLGEHVGIVLAAEDVERFEREIHVGAERRGSKWLLSVRDRGVGIDPEDQERIFDVFERLHSREEHTGSGIGLALCQRIVERHDGDIWVESTPGEGTIFSITLPAVDGE